MQIISNTCVGARIYQILKRPYTTPFIWNVIPYDDFSKLYKNIRTVDFTKVNMSIQSPRKNIVGEISGIKISFVHHLEDKKYSIPTKGTGNTSLDIRCKDIIGNYFKDVFLRRVSRMDMSERFIFILDSLSSFKGFPPITDDQIQDFIGINNDSPDKKILIVNDKKYTSFNSDNLRIIVSREQNTGLNGNTIAHDTIFKKWINLRN